MVLRGQESSVPQQVDLLLRPQIPESVVLEGVRDRLAHAFKDRLAYSCAGVYSDLSIPTDIPRTHRSGPLYLFEDTPSMAALTATQQHGGDFLLNVFLFDRMQPTKMLGVRRGHADDDSGSSGAIHMREGFQGKGLATKLELAWLAELTRVATLLDTDIKEIVLNQNDIRIKTLEKAVLQRSTDPLARLVDQRDLAMRKEIKPRWDRLYGPSGLVGYNYEGVLCVTPDPAFGGLQGAEIVTLRRDMKHDEFSGREVMRPGIVSRQAPKDATEAAERKTAMMNLVVGQVSEVFKT